MITINGLSRDEDNTDPITAAKPLDLSAVPNTPATFYIQGDSFDDLGASELNVLLNGANFDAGLILHHKALHHRFARRKPKVIKVRVKNIFDIVTDKKCGGGGHAVGDSTLTITAINPDATAATFATSSVIFPP